MWWALFAIQLAGSEVFCFVNLVRDQNYSAWAAMGAPPQDPWWSANTAIDGNTNQSYSANSCAITNWDFNKITSIWWKVWLQRPFNIGYLEIYLRSDTYARSTGFSIYTYNTQNFYPFHDPKHFIYRHDPMSGCPSPIMNVTVNYVTQGIVFINERPEGYRSNCPGDNLQYTGIELCEVRVMGCDRNRYTPGCDRLCPTKCKNQQCDVFNGSCIYGCSNPNALTLDCIVCNIGSYIKNQTCRSCQGHCKDDAPCNKLTGRCENGCENRWTGEFCQVCVANYYGRDCNTPCGHCRGDDVCDSVTGQCPHGCKPHWNGTRCDKCEIGFYNTSCSAKCGHCIDNSTCAMENGYCVKGCEKNYLYPRCKECVDHFYGAKCSLHCGRCKNGEACDKDNGYCRHGCKTNFVGSKCDVCKDGFYGSSCEHNCGHCLNGEHCDKRNGTCIKGCQAHFLYPLCNECKDGFYGVNCSDKCGECDDNDFCDKRTGYCLMGCKTNLQPPFCKADPSELQSRSGTSMDEKHYVPETAFYVAIGLLTTLLILSVGVIIYLRRRISGLLQNSHSTTNTQTRNQTQSQNYVDITESEEKHEYTSLETVKQESHYNVI